MKTLTDKTLQILFVSEFMSSRHPRSMFQPRFNVLPDKTVWAFHMRSVPTSNDWFQVCVWGNGAGGSTMNKVIKCNTVYELPHQSVVAPTHASSSSSQRGCYTSSPSALWVHLDNRYNLSFSCRERTVEMSSFPEDRRGGDVLTSSVPAKFGWIIIQSW